MKSFLAATRYLLNLSGLLLAIGFLIWGLFHWNSPELWQVVSSNWADFLEWGGNQPIFIQVSLGILLVMPGIPVLILTPFLVYKFLILWADYCWLLNEEWKQTAAKEPDAM